MDEATLKRWQALHIRAVMGEVLSVDERGFYEAELARLHEEEQLHFDTGKLREVREDIARLKAEGLRLQAEREALEARAALLEAALSQSTRQLIGVGD